MTRSIDSIVANHLCTGCGTCVGVCSARALTMIETSGGLIHPKPEESRCTGCDRCGKVCPQRTVSEAMRNRLSDPYVGPVERAFLSQAVENQTALAGQTGGLGRALLAWSLESGLAQWAVCVTPDPDRPLRPLAALIQSPKDVLTSSRSQYCPIPVNALIQTIRERKGRVAYLGLSWHMQGLELAMERYPDLRDKIALKIGLFCDRVLSYGAIDFLVRCVGLSTEQVREFHYRDKAWQGWPGDVRIEDRQGQVYNLSRAYRTGIREFFTPLSCRLCVDKLNGLADLSLGDPHGLVRGVQVPTAVIARTLRGVEVLEQAQGAGKISLKPIETDDILVNQGVRSRVRNAASCSRQMVKRGFSAPAVLSSFSDAGHTGLLRSLWFRWVCRTGIFFQTPAGIAVTRRLPRWLPRLCNFSERLIRRLKL